MARTVEEGECRIWQGYITNGTPHVAHNGKMVGVRRVLLQLSGVTLMNGDHVGTKCGNCACVEEAHIVRRNKVQHARLMGKSVQNKSVRTAKVAAFKRATGKLTMEAAREIRASDESGPVLAERYGVARSVVSRVRRNEAWREYSNPFAGLGAL